MNVVLYPHPSLKIGGRPVLRVDKTLKEQIGQMFELMYSHNGIGLAAPQVDLPYRLVVINLTGDAAQTNRELVLINPVIVHRGGQLLQHEEGCLSFPGIYAPVIRPARAVVRFFSLKGEQLTLTMEGLGARCVQHETDHLDGLSFVDRLEPPALKKIQPKLDALIQQFNQDQNAENAVVNEIIENATTPQQ